MNFNTSIKILALLIFTLSLLGVAITANGQSQVEELEQKLQTANSDEKADILNRLAQITYEINNLAKSMEYANQALETARKFENVNAEATALINLGLVNSKKSNFQEAISHFKNAQKIYETHNSGNGIAYNLIQIGLCYSKLGNYNGSVENFNKALAIYTKLNDQKGISHAQVSIGDAYNKQKNYEQAISFYKKSVATDEAINDKMGIAHTLNKIGSAYSNWGNFKEAMDHINRALEIAKSNNLMQIYYDLLGNAAIIKKNMEEKAQSKSDYDMAKEEEASNYVKDIETKNIQFKEQTSEFLNRIETLDEANKINALFLKVKENDLNEQLMLKEKKEKELELKNSELALKDAELNRKNAEVKQQETQVKQQETQRNALIGGLVLVLALAFLLFNRYQGKQKANKQLAKINSQLTDSIDYAQRIQSALLTPLEKIRSLLPDSFILFKPKAVVSGDFYWIRQKGNKILFAAADCTGHGVPGAFMSIIGNNVLNQIIALQHLISEPGILLKMLSEEIIDKLQQKKGSVEAEQSQADEGFTWEIKDGMDIALCVLEKESLKLQFAGAHNPLYFIRNGELTEIKGDKLFIGNTTDESKFTSHELQLQKGDCIYIFSDGFADQKGGPDNKKFYYPPFQKLLLDNHKNPMEQQLQILDKTITGWIGRHEQIDDILVFGVRI